MAIRTLCIRPYDYEDTRLFTGRPEYELVYDGLQALLNGKGVKGRRLLVHGERGVGKSITVRRAVQQLLEERQDFFAITVPGERCTTAKELIARIADELAHQVQERFPGEKDFQRESSHVAQMVRVDRTSRSELRKLGGEVELNIEKDIGLLSFIKLTLGIRGALSKEVGREEEAEVTMDDVARLELLHQVLTGIARATGQEPLLFVDNLDQLTRREQVGGLLTRLLDLDQIPVVITIRNEFVSADISRGHRTPIRLGELPANLLLKILNRRLEVDCPDAASLRRKGIKTIGQKLAEVTGNPHAFLLWLDYLCWNTPLRRDRFLEDLQGYVIAHHEVIAEETWAVARWFIGRGNKRANRDELIRELNLDADDVAVLEQQGVIIPDDITRPEENRRYTLSPRLAFVRLLG